MCFGVIKSKVLTFNARYVGGILAQHMTYEKPKIENLNHKDDLN